MESLVTPGQLPAEDFWRGKSVLVTGHTGFKGGWLCHWLNALGAQVHGLALDPGKPPNIFDESRVTASLATDSRVDIGNLDAVTDVLARVRPQIVFHMAAQSLVRTSYRDPIETLRTNTLGTAHILEAMRYTDSVDAAVIVTTDKVYRNREWVHPYRENDELGGGDPYSASKSAAEIVTHSYRYSFFAEPDAPRIMTARAGNVIGGGDWSPERLVPDLLRAADEQSVVQLRFPGASRPWQHVLEPLSGYLLLAEMAATSQSETWPTAWNFGPDASSVLPVLQVVRFCEEEIGAAMPIQVLASSEMPEAQLLALDSTQARTILGWHPRWSVKRALQITLSWHREWKNGSDMREVTLKQIDEYRASING